MRLLLALLLTASLGLAAKASSTHMRDPDFRLRRRSADGQRLLPREPGKSKKGAADGAKSPPGASRAPQKATSKASGSPRSGRTQRTSGTASLTTTPPVAQGFPALAPGTQDGRQMEIPAAESGVPRRSPRLIQPPTSGTSVDTPPRPLPPRGQAFPAGQLASTHGEQMNVALLSQNKPSILPTPAQRAMLVGNSGSATNLLHGLPNTGPAMAPVQSPLSSMMTGSQPRTRSQTQAQRQSQRPASLQTPGVSQVNPSVSDAQARSQGQAEPQHQPRSLSQSRSSSPSRSLPDDALTSSLTGSQTSAISSMSSESSFASSRGARLPDGRRPVAWTRGRGRNTRDRSPEDPDDLDWRPGRAARMGDL